jgi:hypothetical protein
MSDKLFVICGNRSEYMTFVHKKVNELLQCGQTSITFSHFVYVDSADNLSGYSNPKGWFVGSWREKKGINEIMVQLLLRKRNYALRPEFKEILTEWRAKGRI